MRSEHGRGMIPQNKQKQTKKLFQERGMDPGQTKAVDVHLRGVCVLELRGFLEIIFPESHTVKGGGGVEINQVPAFGKLTVGRRMMPCRQEVVT